MNYATVDQIKIILAALFSLFLLARLLRSRVSARDPAGPARRQSRFGQVLLIALAILSTVNFYHFGYFHTRFLTYGWLDKQAFLHLWELYHYYNGAKYFDELGYHNLYNATIAADAEDGGRLAGVHRIRDLDTGGFLSRDQVLALSPDCKARFSSKRWQQFQHDVRYFTQRLPAEVMGRILVDHGYNPTPTWNTTGSFIANHLPVERLASLALADIVILVAIVVALGVTYGCETGLVATTFFGINAFSAFSYTGGSFLRYDWLLGLVLGLCLFHRRHYACAGAFLAYAALVRLFPALFLFGLAIKAGYETACGRALPPRYTRVFLSFLLASVLFFGYGSLNKQGLASWKEFAAKIGEHHRTLSANSVGFAMVFLHDATWDDPVSFALAYGTTGEVAETAFKKIMDTEARSRRASYLVFSLAVLALGALVVIGLSDEEALAWGFLPVFVFLNVSNYYYAFLIINAVVWFSRYKYRPAPLLLLSAMQVLVLGIGLSIDYPLRATAISSLVFFLFVLTLISCELLANVDQIRMRLAALVARKQG